MMSGSWWLNIITTYYDGSGACSGVTNLAGVYWDSASSQGTTLTDATVESAVSHAMSAAPFVVDPNGICACDRMWAGAPSPSVSRQHAGAWRLAKVHWRLAVAHASPTFTARPSTAQHRPSADIVYGDVNTAISGLCTSWCGWHTYGSIGAWV